MTTGTGANGNGSASGTTAPPAKKRSRFSEAPANMAAVTAPVMPGLDPLALAQAKAAEIARGLGLVAAPVVPVPPQMPMAMAPVVPMMGGAAPQSSLLQQQILQQLAQAQGAPPAPPVPAKPQVEKKAKFIAFRVDELGREIDEHGNLVKMDLSNIKTVRANIGGPAADKKPEEEKKEKEEKEEEKDDGLLPVMDPRLKVRDRGRRAMKAFDFVEHGTYIKKAEQFRNREARKVMAGYASGRNPNAIGRGGDGIFKVDEEDGEAISAVTRLEMPAPVDDGPHPHIEWWDEVFLPKEKRAELSQQPSAYEAASVDHCKTLKYVQHPLQVKGAAAEEETAKLTTYLTKKERKRLRKQARAEREQEKRDKIALGLMPPPPPKMNLGNFMKILGDEAVADPSKVTAMVMKQVEQRKMNHEMRNQANKLTPEERRAKKRKRLMEDTSKGVHVALFRVRDLSNPQIRFKVDVNAQESMLSGGVLMCKDPSFGELGTNLVVVEGGPKAIRRYVKLMLRRIKWTSASKEGDDDDDEDDDDSDDDEDYEGGGGHDSAGSKCELLWQGIVAKRAFNGFRFQECKTSTTARRVMEAKGVSHYWDMVMKAPTNAGQDSL